MALIAHYSKVSFLTYSSRPKGLSSRLKWRSSATPQLIYSKDEFAQLKYHFRFRCQPVTLTKRKAFKVSSFKGNPRNDETEGNGTKVSTSSVQLSAPEREEVSSEFYDATKDPVSYVSEEKIEYKAKSRAIKQLFKKWLVILQTQTQTSNHTLNESCNEKSSQSITEESQQAPKTLQAGNVLKALVLYFLRLDTAISVPLLLFCNEKSSQSITEESQQAPKTLQAGNVLKALVLYFLRLDTAISVPLLLFIPVYLTVRLKYGAEVSKELMPLWFIGPMIVALYVKIIQALCSLYALLFMQAIRLVINLPTCSVLAYNYIAEGRLKSYLWAPFLNPTADIIDMDYGVFVKQKYKQLEAWAIEKYLDFVELIWPYYCRTIRFLKKANFL